MTDYRDPTRGSNGFAWGWIAGIAALIIVVVAIAWSLSGPEGPTTATAPATQPSTAGSAPPPAGSSGSGMSGSSTNNSAR
ncbi:MAG TPA: hypothetical protein VNR11_08660 [Xanthobacteraceae bacterium]|nr:hypothetical protein [Xanthobacteraceae bacterium]